MTDTHAATELEQYIENDADLHRQQGAPILKNLATKKARGEYKHALAVKLFGYLVESGAKKYAKAFGSPNQPWHKMFDVPTRKRVAEELTKSFEAEHALGNYANLLPKKYQKPEKAAVAHARKKVSWKTPESLKIVWSPVNIAWLALWPGRGRIQDQQVLKIADTDGMHSWLRETYGDPYGRVGASRVHSTMSSAHARKKSAAQLNREIAAALGKRRSA